MKSIKYKATNTTIKPVRQNPRGQDIRPVRDRVGYGVEFVVGEPPNDRRVTIQPGKSIILETLSEGVLKLFRKGEITVTEVKDIGEELKNFTFKKEEKTSAPEMAKIKEPEPMEETSPYEKVIPSDVNARAVPSGEIASEERMVNPDGEPNFVAKAPRGGLKRNKKAEYTEGEPEASLIV